MAKKEFITEKFKRLDELSDVELIEKLEGRIGPVGDMNRDIIKAILDKRLKISIQDLIRKIETLNKTTSFYSLILIILTLNLINIGLLTLSASPVANLLEAKIIGISTAAISIIVLIMAIFKRLKN